MKNVLNVAEVQEGHDGPRRRERVLKKERPDSGGWVYKQIRAQRLDLSNQSYH